MTLEDVQKMKAEAAAKQQEAEAAAAAAAQQPMQPEAPAAEQMPHFARIRNTVLWVYGFEYMAPALMELIVSAAESAPEVNIVFTGEFEEKSEYDMFARMTSALRTMCARL